ncbi:MAG TPA: HTH domain-containing protein [Candidatus Elarobacter sp.]|jgi:hypothetical protein
MTTAHFDALASTTPRQIAASALQHAAYGTVSQRLVRLVWLTARFVRHDSVTIEDFRRRFGVGVRTFRRDIATLRDAGMYIDADPNAYRMTCFVSDGDGA